MADASPPGDRLDSWKAIAEYLQRDVGTVRRWEKALGLPVRRVAGGMGRSVFAYTAEIDAWLLTSAERPQTPVALPPARRRLQPAWIAAVLSLGVLAVAAWWVRAPAAAITPLRIEATADTVSAFDPDGSRRWQHVFPAEYQMVLLGISDHLQVFPGNDPFVYVATAQRFRKADRAGEGGQLMLLGGNGELRRTFEFDDVVTFGGTPYGPPWAVSAFAANHARGQRRVAIAAHHWTWSPSVVTLLDENWQRVATFAHSGWIEQLQWLESGQLVVGGFAQAQNGGMVALLDPANMQGQGVELEGSTHHCDGCGPARPLRMIVMPRSEINLVTGSRFNRAMIDNAGGTLVVHTIEVPSDSSGSATDAVYEFTPGLELVRASYSEKYWDLHQRLAAEGTLDHTKDTCPDRHGPRAIQIWEPATGWRTVSTAAAARASAARP